MILRFGARPAAVGRILGFPYAGASPAWLRTWALETPSTVELLACAYPGRDEAPPLDRIDRVVPRLVDAMVASKERPLERPFVLYGHSIGAWVAFEVARALRTRGLPGPRALVVSGRQAPSCPPRFSAIGRLGDADFLAAVIERYNAIPQAVLDEPELLAMLLPGLRADLAMGESYRWDDPTPLDLPIFAYGGDQDPFVDEAELAAWRSCSTAPVHVERWAGGHFFVDQPGHRRALLDRLVELVLR